MTTTDPSNQSLLAPEQDYIRSVKNSRYSRFNKPVSFNMVVKLKHELIVNSYKTIDGRGVNVAITGGGCITLQYVSNVIIHNMRVYDCNPTGNTNIRSSPTLVGYRRKSVGDGISIAGSRNLWIDHCSLSHCTDGLIDAVLGSTAITISNSYFTHHNEVMLMGHDDGYLPDKGMQVKKNFCRGGKTPQDQKIDLTSSTYAQVHSKKKTKKYKALELDSFLTTGALTTNAGSGTSINNHSLESDEDSVD